MEDGGGRRGNTDSSVHVAVDRASMFISCLVHAGQFPQEGADTRVSVERLLFAVGKPYSQN